MCVVYNLCINIMDSETYNFPFDTCEKVQHGLVAQPYSALINLLILAMLAIFMYLTKTQHAFLLLCSIFIFEAFHTLSHTIHFNSTIQINITHGLAYLMNIAFFYLFYNVTGVLPSFNFIVLILFLIALDIYMVFYYSFIYYLITMSLIFFSLLLFYYSYLPKFVKKNISMIVATVIFIILLFINEKTNCKQMLELYPNVPFHTIIELSGLFLFYVIASTFYKL